jgi:hypothetical protein
MSALSNTGDHAFWQQRLRNEALRTTQYYKKKDSDPQITGLLKRTVQNASYGTPEKRTRRNPENVRAVIPYRTKSAYQTDEKFIPREVRGKCSGPVTLWMQQAATSTNFYPAL